MKDLLFDPAAGASGDMIMASLLDIGASEEAVREAVESVGCRLEVSRIERSHIIACRARVISDRRHSSLEEATAILKGSSLKGQGLENALRALDILAAAEGRVHGMAKESVRFHEIGALDALADIAGSFAALESLAVERVMSRPVSVGGGFVQAAHGLLSVPGPATLEILRSHKIPWKGGPAEAELLTPTGAALLAAMVDEFVPEFPLIRAEKVGYGAGKRELELPNVLRALIAEPIPESGRDSAQERELASGHNQGPHGDDVVQLETNVDDVTGEVIGHLIELLMEEGALDASVLPALMKKGRGGYVIRAIAKHEEMEKLARIMIRETGSLGVRVFPSLHRFVAEREEARVKVKIGGRAYEARVKISRIEGLLLNIKAEYDDCHKIAIETGLALRLIIKKVEEEGWRTARL
jgi:uncharacterized protein (TIGR00299 family) protein